MPPCVKQRGSNTGMDWRGIAEEVWTQQDPLQPRPPPNCHQDWPVTRRCNWSPFAPTD